MNWLINRKKYKPFIYIITIVVYAANMALLMICVRFAYCIIKGIQTDWYKKAELTASRDDMFFADKSQVVFFTLAIVFVCYFRVSQTSFGKYEKRYSSIVYSGI